MVNVLEPSDLDDMHEPTLMPWADIGCQLNMSRQTVCKVHDRALRKIRRALLLEPDIDELLGDCRLSRKRKD